MAYVLLMHSSSWILSTAPRGCLALGLWNSCVIIRGETRGRSWEYGGSVKCHFELAAAAAYTQRRVMPYRGHTSAGLRVFLAGFVTFTGPAAGSVIFSSPFATVQSPNGQSRLIAVADGNFHTRGTAVDRRCLVPRRKDESAPLDFLPPKGFELLTPRF